MNQLIRFTLIIFIISPIFNQNILSLEYLGGDSLKVILTNQDEISGFELQIDGIDILSASLGSSDQLNGFEVSTNTNQILGFSFTAGSISPGEYHLSTVYFDSEYENIAAPCFSTDSGNDGLPNCVISSPSGDSLELELGECASGCFDNTACNYLTNQDCISPTIYYQDADADELGNPDVSQSSCEPIEGYVTDNTDDDDSCGGSVGSDGSCCNSEIFDECGICDGDNSTCSDCTGAPNGDAILDECGVCNGDNSTCSDCAGVPNGNASVDACGNCNGDCTQDVNQNSLIICSSQEFNSNNLVVADCAGECGGNAVADCAGECGGNAVLDECGICDGSGVSPDFCDCDGNILDCAGECGGSAVADCAGECGGSAVADCAGECGGNAVLDECDICDGSGVSPDFCDCDGNILDCAGECGGSAVIDECDVCNGDGSSCLSVFDNNFPDKFEINNIYPNPFNPTVNIQFSVFKAGTIAARIVSLDGQLIKNFENAFYSSGIYNLKWSPENIPSGLYFFQIESNISVKTKKLVYMK